MSVALTNTPDVFVQLREEAAEYAKETFAELRRADQLGYQMDADGRNLQQASRTDSVRRARKYARVDASARQLTALWTNFPIGAGFTFSSDDAKLQKVIDEDFLSKGNRSTTSQTGQRENAAKAFVDGEMFFAIWPKSKPIAIRRIDPLEITGRVTNREDKEEVYLWLREMTDSKGSVNHIAYPAIYSPLDAGQTGAETPEKYKLQEDAVVYHVRYGLGDRGESGLLPALDWIVAHRRFLRARIALVASLSQFAWDDLVKSGPTDVARHQAAIQSSLQVGGATETNPPAAPGSTFVHNEGIERKSIRPETGASNALIDANQLMQMIGLAGGVFGHYMGGGEAYRLATATAMEPPMMKQFLASREQWRGVYRDIIEYIAISRGLSVTPSDIKIEAPPIVERDAPALIGALSRVLPMMPELAAAKEMQRYVVEILGVHRPEEVVEDSQMSETGRRNIRETLGLPSLEALNEQETLAGVVDALDKLDRLADARKG